jgi:membrane-associated phospholipid phosphatase
MVPIARGEIGADMSEVTRISLDDTAQRRRLVVWVCVWAAVIGAALGAIHRQPQLDARMLLAINAAAAKIPGIATGIAIMDANGAELLLATSIVALWFLSHSAGEDMMRRRALLTVLAFFPTYGLARVMQGLDHRTRPILSGIHLQPLTDPTTWHQMAINFTHWGSFPSDHAALVAIVLVAAWSVSRRAGVALALLAVLVGLFRIAVGYHWPSDVLGGTLLGLIVAAVLFALEGKLAPLLDAMLKKIDANPALSYALAFIVLSDIGHGFATARTLAHTAFHAQLFH